MLQNIEGIFEGHGTAEIVPVDTIGEGKTVIDESSFHTPRKQPKDESDYRPARQVLSPVLHGKPEIIMRNPHPLDLVLLREFKGGIKDHRMDMHVEMAVNVRKPESGGTKPLKLGGEFLYQLLSGQT